MPPVWLQIPLYILVFYGVFFGIAFHRKRRSKVRPPLTDKLRRWPGFTLQKQINERDSDLWIPLFLAPILPPFLALTAFLLPTWMGQPQPSYWWIVPVVIVICGFAFGLQQAFRELNFHRSHNLGLYGERIVAEQL